MAKVSIIIPVYNVADFLHKSLGSVINQTLEDIEIICIDDCSTDNSLNILKEYAAKDKRFVIIEQSENQGQGVARNKGIEIATGEYIMFLDPDDWFELSACEDAYKQATKYNNDIIFFNAYNYDECLDLGIIDNFRLRPFYGYTNNSFKLKDVVRPILTGGEVWYKAYKTSFVHNNNIKFANTRLGEDMPFTIKSYLLAETTSVLPKCLYNYRRNRDNSSTSSRDIADFDLYIREKEKALDLITNNKEYNWLIPAYIRYYINSIYFFHGKFKKNNNEEKIVLYNKVRNILIKLNDTYKVKEYVEDNVYKRFINQVKYSYIQSKLIKLIKI